MGKISHFEINISIHHKKLFCDLQDVLLYSIIDQAGETEPFYMAPSTGIITLKQLLTGTTKTSYSVRKI